MDGSNEGWLEGCVEGIDEGCEDTDGWIEG